MGKLYELARRAVEARVSEAEASARAHAERCGRVGGWLDRLESLADFGLTVLREEYVDSKVRRDELRAEMRAAREAAVRAATVPGNGTSGYHYRD